MLLENNAAMARQAGMGPNLIDGMHRAALHVLIRSADGRNNISDAYAMKMAQALPNVAGDRLHAGNLKRVLQVQLTRMGELDLKAIDKYVSPKNPDAPLVDVSDKPLGANPARQSQKSLEEVQAELDARGPDWKAPNSLHKRTPNRVIGAPGTAPRTVSQEFVDRQTAKANRPRPTSTAPEVAGAARPKGQPTQSGGNKSFLATGQNVAATTTVSQKDADVAVRAITGLWHGDTPKVHLAPTFSSLPKEVQDSIEKADQTCLRRLNIDPPCRSNIDPGRVAAF